MKKHRQHCDVFSSKKIDRKHCKIFQPIGVGFLPKIQWMSQQHFIVYWIFYGTTSINNFKIIFVWNCFWNLLYKAGRILRKYISLISTHFPKFCLKNSGNILKNLNLVKFKETSEKQGNIFPRAMCRLYSKK